MIRAPCTATGAIWWACAAIVLAVIGIGLLRAFWRDWRTPRCRWCFVPLTWENHRHWLGFPITGHRHVCDDCIRAWDCRHRRLPREVMG